MKCSRLRQHLIRYEQGDMPPDLAAHLEQCPACRKHVERTSFLRKLIALKRYEHPSPGLESRLVAGVRRRLEKPVAEDQGAPGWVWELLVGRPVPALRYALAAVLVLLLGVHLLSMPQLPAPPPWAAQIPQAPVSSAGRPAMPVNVLAPSPVAIGEVASNIGPGRIEYGPLPSSVAGFEY